jgi:hypothetical protein
MVCFQTQNPSLGKCLRALDWKLLIKFMAIWIILLSLGIFHDRLVHFVFIGYIFSGFGIVHQKNLATLGHTNRKASILVVQHKFGRTMQNWCFVCEIPIKSVNLHI